MEDDVSKALGFSATTFLGELDDRSSMELEADLDAIWAKWIPQARHVLSAAGQIDLLVALVQLHFDCLAEKALRTAGSDLDFDRLLREDVPALILSSILNLGPTKAEGFSVAGFLEAGLWLGFRAYCTGGVIDPMGVDGSTRNAAETGARLAGSLSDRALMWRALVSRLRAEGRIEVNLGHGGATVFELERGADEIDRESDRSLIGPSGDGSMFRSRQAPSTKTSERINEFLWSAQQLVQESIFKEDLWRHVAGYEWATSFEKWQGEKSDCTKAARKAFERILTEGPVKFIEVLEKKRTLTRIFPASPS